MSKRQRLPNRREAETFDVQCEGVNYRATIGRFADGRPAEIFIHSEKASSALDAVAMDSSVLASIALQFGAPLDVIRHALLRDAQGRASSPLGVALDILGRADA